MVKLKHIDRHPLAFVVQGLISLCAGGFFIFTAERDLKTLVTIVAVTLFLLGLVEVFNVVHRAKVRETWLFSLSIAVVEVAIAFILLFLLHQNVAWHLGIIAGYTLARGLAEILIGMRSIDDSTDKFIWTVTGVIGAIMGFVIFCSGNTAENVAFIQFFGSYMMIFGVANLIYGVHNRDQYKEYRAERKQIAKKTAKKSTKKVAKKRK